MAAGLRANFAVVAEPTSLQIVDAHRGLGRWKGRPEARACHSSTPEQGLTAVYRMGHVLPLIELYANRLQQSSSHPRLGPPTLSVGRIEGGVSVNTVPDRCRIEIDRRLIAGEIPDEASGHFLSFLKEKAGIDFPFELTSPWIRMPALSPEGSEEIQKLLGSAIDAERGSHKVHPVPYGTDAATLAYAGIPSVVFGPGDIAKAHTVDEWVPLDEVETASKVLYRLACSIA